MDPFIGQIMQVGFRYAPVNWLTCNGAPLPVNQNQALYALLGNSFGGTPPNTFCLPDARGRSFIGTGTGPGLTPRAAGGSGGAEAVALTTAQLPAHTHSATFTPSSSGAFNGTLTAIAGVPRAQEVATPTNGCFLGSTAEQDTTPVLYVPAASATQPGAVPVSLAGLQGSVTSGGGVVTIAPTGGSAPVATMPPFLAVTTIIASVGIWPEQP
ncbi:tail fiber protein [Sphingomonas sp. CARO-RG-8B-R24-01]|uniref:phage tail protein n=1 Tax=Sphingomonas sp. CARO-RG-8B-R24-01 TaxID=2914831 RepID=UPI001F589708|nr:tail fiber protein [Sphingomonas sp. CARO-RG-8B-R24-01]